MENEKKKSNIGIILIIIILLLLIGFAVWFFLLRDKGTNKTNNGGNNTNTEENTNNEKTITEETSEFNYTDGILHEIGYFGEEIPFTIDGIILAGNRHSYENLEAGAEGIMTKLIEKGYKKSDINSSFYLNEWIEFYIDTKYEGPAEDIKILITPHKVIEELQKMSLTQLEEFASENGGYVIDYQTPDEENYKYVGEGYVNLDYPEGKYNILFAYKGKLVYYICIDLTKEEE